MSENGRFVVIDVAERGAGYEIAHWSHQFGRLYALAARPNHPEAVAAAAVEAERLGGLPIVDRIGGDA